MKNNPLLRDVKKKTKRGDHFLIILILAVAGGTGFSFIVNARNQFTATEDFLVKYSAP